MFIPLKLSEEGHTEWANINHISSLEEVGNTTMVRFNTKECWKVLEPIQEVIKKIQRASISIRPDPYNGTSWAQIKVIGG